MRYLLFILGISTIVTTGIVVGYELYKWLEIKRNIWAHKARIDFMRSMQEKMVNKQTKNDKKKNR